MPERFQVCVSKDYLVFCSGHFISYEGDKCERLHGHNYRAAVAIEGALDENFYVFDFITLKNRTRAITEELDHRMMLPTRNRVIRLEESPRSVRVAYIGERLREDLRQSYGYVPQVLRVEVEESFGQSARYEWRADVSTAAHPRG